IADVYFDNDLAYVPRLDAQALARSSTNPRQILRLDASMELEVLLAQIEHAHEHIHALLLDFTHLYTQGVPALESLDLLGYVRRLSSKPLIHQDYFLKPYQLLESVVHGSDAIVLNVQLLGADFKSMHAYATRLGLLSIAEVSSTQDLKTSILARSQTLYLRGDFKPLLELTPQRKTILKDADPACPDNTYGVDSLIIS
ncbi:indole-3-glycerol phosphate synthase, partial [Helicobacter baculiformis]